MAITDLALSFTPIPGGAFAGGYASFQNGGGREAATAIARNAIPDYLRSAGMTAWQQDTNEEWRLNPGPWIHTDADWTLTSSQGVVIFDGGVITRNVRSNRPANQSSIDNAKIGITNLGSDTGGAGGAIGNYSCIPGGDRCSASGDYSYATNFNCDAIGNMSFAGGDNSQSTGITSLAFGDNCSALNDGAIALGTTVNASAARSFGCGLNTTTNGVASHVEGDSCITTGIASHAEGNATQSVGDASHSEGNTTQAAGNNSHAEGSGTVSNGLSSHAEGVNSITGVSGQAAHAEGQGTDASGVASHAEGNGTISSGLASHAEGGSQATGDFSHGSGNGAVATRYGQKSHSSGDSVVTPLNQASLITLRGLTPGVGAGESVELAFGDNATPISFIPDDARAYTIKATVIACSAGPLTQSFELNASVRRNGGTVVIAGTSTPVQYGDAGAASWTFAITAGITPDRVVFTFTTGATTVAANIACEIDFIETVFP